MSLFDTLIEFDAALEWPLDDPLLADDQPIAVVAAEGWGSPPPPTAA